MLEEKKSSTKSPDPYKIKLPDFDYSILSKTKKIGTSPKEVLDAVGVKEGDHVADFGCGAGFYTIEVAKVVGSSGKVFAIDMEKDILDHLKQKALDSGMRNIYGVLTNLEKENATGLDSGAIDVVLMVNLLYLVKNKKLVLQEAHRILKDHGKMVIMDWSEKGKMSILEREDMVKGREVKELATKLGFKRTHNFEAGIGHEVSVFVKV